MEANNLKNKLNSGDRVSEAQFNILLDFLERHPIMVQGSSNNSKVRRDQTNRLWQVVASLLNAHKNKYKKGMTRSPRRWANYVSNYKCKLKKTIAAMEKSDKAVLLEFSDKEVRFMVVTGLVQPSDVKNVNWDPLEEPSTSTEPEFLEMDVKPTENDIAQFNMDDENDIGSPIDDRPDNDDDRPVNDDDDEEVDDKSQVLPLAQYKSLKRPKDKPKLKKTVRSEENYKSSQTSLNTVLRLLKKQQSSIDAQNRMLKRIALNTAQRSTNNTDTLNLIAYNLGRLADAADRYVTSHVRRNRTSHIN